MVTLLLLLAVGQAQAPPLPATETPVNYIVSVAYYEGECRFLPTDVGLTAGQLTAKLKSFNRSNGIELIFGSSVPCNCIDVGRKAALAAGFTMVTARLATPEDLGHGRVP